MPPPYKGALGPTRTRTADAIAAWNTRDPVAPPVAHGEADRDAAALEGYRAAAGWIGTDSWDGCSDCVQMLKAASAADYARPNWSADELAAAVKRVRLHCAPKLNATGRGHRLATTEPKGCPTPGACSCVGGGYKVPEGFRLVPVETLVDIIEEAISDGVDWQRGDKPGRYRTVVEASLEKALAMIAAADIDHVGYVDTLDGPAAQGGEG